MSVTVIVTFRAKPGLSAALSDWLLALHSTLHEYAGFEGIALCRELGEPEQLVEIEHWAHAADHRGMVDAIDARGGWAALEDLVQSEPITKYFEPVPPSPADETRA